MNAALQLEDVVTAAASVGARVSGLLVFTPFLGSNAIAPRIKVGFVVLLTALLYPVCGPRGMSLTAGGALRMMLSEALIGILIGLAAQFVFEAAVLAGQVMGTQVGYGLVNILDPNTQVDTPVLSVFTQTMAMLIFLQLGVHRWLVRALAASFSYLPAGTALATGAMIHQLLHAAGGIWLAGVQLAAPVLLATLMVDLVLGFLGKASPQLPIMIMGISLKSMLGMLALIGSLAYWPRLFEIQFSRSVELCERMLRLAH